ncbi:MAG: hypothetical protein BGO13_06110 [Burkholderiales bacterium 66-5]|nr:MAG: hypothetical protein BGO13_06110 [Burkholderiales bacterium 66-5]
MQGTLLVGWGAIIPGREKQAAQVLGEAMGYLTALKCEGRLDGMDAVLLEPHGGELEGFVLLRGDAAQLAALRAEPAFVRTIVAVQLVHAKVRVVAAFEGAAMQSLMGIWDEQEDRLLG